MTRLVWLGYVLLWFWPLTLAAIAFGAVWIYGIIGLVRLLPYGVNW